MSQVVHAHTRILGGEGVSVCESPDPLETCPYEVRLAEGDKFLLAKVPSQAEGELLKVALLCMYQQLAADAPAIIKNDITNKLGVREYAAKPAANTGEITAPIR